MEAKFVANVHQAKEVVSPNHRVNKRVGEEAKQVINATTKVVSVPLVGKVNLAVCHNPNARVNVKLIRNALKHSKCAFHVIQLTILIVSLVISAMTQIAKVQHQQ